MKYLQSYITITFILLTGFTEFAVGQNMRVIDSLQNRLALVGDSERFDLLNAIGFEYRYSHPDSTIYYCSEAYNLGNKLSLKKNLSRSLSFIGLAYTYRGDYKKSLEYHDHAIEVAANQKDSVQLGHGYNNLGRMFFDGGDQMRAINNFYKALEIFERLKDKSGLAYVYRSLSSVYKAQQEYDKAIEMSEKAYRIRRETGDTRGIISALTEFGLVYKDQGYLNLALEKYSQAESLAQEVDDEVTQAEVLMAIAEINFVQKNIEQALENAEEVLHTISEVTNQKLFVRASFIKAQVQMVNKEYNEAITLLEKILSQSRTSGNLEFELEALALSAQCYEKLNKMDKVRQYRDEHKLLTEKLKNTDLLREIDKLEFQLMIEKIEAENKALKSTQIANRALIEQQRFQNGMLIGAAISLLIFSTILIIFNQKRKAANQKLADINEQVIQQQKAIKEVNDKLIARNRELSELNSEKDSLMSIVAHDLKAPLNRISGLVTLIELNNNLNPEQKEYVHLIKGVTKSGTDLIADLLDVNSLNESGKHHEVETHIDFKQLILSRINSFQLSAEAKLIEIKFSDSITYSFFSVSDYWTRIIDNLISNAIKFSSLNASLFIEGTTEPGFAVFRIKDEGPGFTEEDKQSVFQRFKKLSARPTGGESSNGLGLAIVKTLVERLRGTISLNSKSGEGAEFVVKVPVAKVTQLKS